jgi:hypothetical protein
MCQGFVVEVEPNRTTSVSPTVDCGKEVLWVVIRTAFVSLHGWLLQKEANILPSRNLGYHVGGFEGARFEWKLLWKQAGFNSRART